MNGDWNCAQLRPGNHHHRCMVAPPVLLRKFGQKFSVARMRKSGCIEAIFIDWRRHQRAGFALVDMLIPPFRLLRLPRMHRQRAVGLAGLSIGLRAAPREVLKRITLGPVQPTRNSPHEHAGQAIRHEWSKNSASPIT